MTMEEREELRLFVGKNADYYIAKWEELGEENKISWNWSAFFFGLLWFAYRKMYPHAFGFIVFSLILQYIQIVMKTHPLVIGITNILISIFIGMFGNYLYYQYAKSKIKQIKENIKDERQKTVEIVRAGGTSLSTAIAIGLMYLIASSIIDYGLQEDNSENFREQKSINPWSS
ncbi:DUF2628 domain-containing protein [Sulfurihydrogenibium azorense]|uniref:DUF2628 domain-containing protein n=1 Tax=Sulfurihydrogenibium azorense TaxID=309806 RepID=UPI00240A0EEA|nr:DUF2628 domain-containing protein [Sulfurihydrogenibium azorense]MDM7273552.1 DUF2628 domain-containing protein [Sulfurihydrogenibium azorense]